MPKDSIPEPLPLAPAFVKLTGRERTREERREERTRVAEAKKEAAEQARLAKALKRAEARSSARGSGRGGRGRGRGMSREDRADARRQRLAEEAMADGAPVTKEPRRRNGPLTPAQTGYAELAKLSSYPWNAQPMTRRVMLNMDDMPSNLVNALRPHRL